MINNFNFKRLNDQYLLTNDFGKYYFLDDSDFQELVVTGTVNDARIHDELENRKFIYEGSMKSFVDDNAFLMRDAKDYLFHPSQLHIFVVTSACNMRCVYCQAQNGNATPNGFMTKEIARRAVDIALQSPTNYLNFEFQGGEPLLNFDVIKYIVEYSQTVCGNKTIEYSVVTNLTLLTDEMIAFFKTNHVSVSTSIDGDMRLHDMNRPYHNGKGTFEDVCASIQKLRDAGLHVGALLTTTRAGLTRWREIIDTYVEYGFDSISLRPLTPLGCANKEWDVIGYTADEFIDFYKNALDYIIDINETIYFREAISSIFLRKILEGCGSNYMELRSPCGASLGQIAYYYDGNIYTCDEGRMVSEMGNQSFCLGNVYTSDYDSLMDCDICKVVCTASILESIPSCAECVYQPYCGVCPVVNYALTGDVYEKTPNNYRCQINKGMLDTIFEKLQTGDIDDGTYETFRRWIK